MELSQHQILTQGKGNTPSLQPKKVRRIGTQSVVSSFQECVAPEGVAFAFLVPCDGCISSVGALWEGEKSVEFIVESKKAEEAGPVEMSMPMSSGGVCVEPMNVTAGEWVKFRNGNPKAIHDVFVSFIFHIEGWAQ